LDDIDKDKEQLTAEVAGLRRQVEQLKELGNHHILDSLVEHVIYEDIDMRIIWLNRAACQSVSMSREELIGRYCYEVWLNRIDPCPDCPVIKAIKTGRPQMIEKPTPDGKYWYIRGNPVRNKKGEIVGAVEVTLDISKRKSIEEALQESEEKYRHLIQHSNDAIYLLFNRKFEFINDKFQEMFGVTLKEVNQPKFDFIQLVAPKSRPLIEERIIRVAQGETLEPKYEFTALSEDGNEIEVETSVSYVNYKNEIATQGIIRDITARKRLEEQLRQSQKIEGIGRLAGGIAHDFNNLLTSIIGYAEMGQRKLPPDSPIHKNLKHILKTSNHASSLIQQLLAFSRKAMVQPRVLDLNRVINNFKNILERILGEDIAFKFFLDKKLGNVKADPGQIEQIIMNLAVNSRDALPQGGNLIIETANMDLDEKYARLYTYVKPGRYVLLSVSDTGCGMDEETLSHIFEPFFTTKEKGVGTGLGLSTVYGITKQSGGHINVYSELEKGTTVKIYLPRIDEPAEAPPGQIGSTQMVTGKETILVVEDEESVREIAIETLSACGYTVITAGCGADALSLWDKHTEKIDLLLTDVVLPGMSGRDIAEQLAASDPGLKVLYMSGYTVNVISHYGVVDKNIAFIQKPFTPTKLARKIREVLDL
jgi:PAS domain S-box-containing protein